MTPVEVSGLGPSFLTVLGLFVFLLLVAGAGVLFGIGIERQHNQEKDILEP